VTIHQTVERARGTLQKFIVAQEKTLMSFSSSVQFSYNCVNAGRSFVEN